jgi:hypothetical protein
MAMRNSKKEKDATLRVTAGELAEHLAGALTVLGFIMDGPLDWEIFSEDEAGLVTHIKETYAEACAVLTAYQKRHKPMPKGEQLTLEI